MGAQVGRADQHGRDHAKLGGVGRADQHPHVPQSGLAVCVQFGEPARRPVGVEPGAFLVVPAEHVQPGPQVGDLGIDEGRRLGHHEPAERPGHQRGQGGLEQRRGGEPGPGGQPGVTAGAGLAGWPGSVARPAGRARAAAGGGGGRRLASRARRPGQRGEIGGQPRPGWYAAGTPGEQQIGPAVAAGQPRAGRARAGRPRARRPRARPAPCSPAPCSPAPCSPARAGRPRARRPRAGRPRAGRPVSGPAGPGWRWRTRPFSTGGAGGSGPEFVISSSGAPPPRDSQPATNGCFLAAASSAAGSTAA